MSAAGAGIIRQFFTLTWVLPAMWARPRIAYGLALAGRMTANRTKWRWHLVLERVGNPGIVKLRFRKVGIDAAEVSRTVLNADDGIFTHFPQGLRQEIE